MPVENERKYVLTLEPDRLLDEIYWSPEAERLPWIEIFQQHYVQDKCRIRRVESISGDRGEELFTFKQPVNGEVVEIECNLNPEDFDKLASVAQKGLTKCRLIVDVEDYVWEVDFFVPTGTDGIPFKQRILHSYLIMAEVELDKDETEPDAFPGFITDNLVYTVPKGDPRFNSSSLTNPQESRKLYDSLIESN